MGEVFLLPMHHAALKAVLRSMAPILATRARLPDLPFRARGHIDVCCFDQVLGAQFAGVLAALAGAHGDDAISFAAIEPDPVDFYRRHYGVYPAFTMPVEQLEPDGYADRLTFEPDDDPAGAIAYTANVVALAGSSRQWAVWAERRWAVGLVFSRGGGGPWLDEGVPFATPAEALAGDAEPGEDATLAADLRVELLRNIRVGRTGR